MNALMVTGGAGFIGSNFIRYVFEKSGFKGKVICFDKLTYAGNPRSLSDIEMQYKDRYVFIKGDICNREVVDQTIKAYQVDTIVHFAAESHVDRSIQGPAPFVETNIVGTFTLLEACRNLWKDRKDVRFHHVSTDEVYGSLGDTGHFFETTPYDPRSPYSASKAASDHFVMAYYHTYGLPVSMSNCSNNYGPYHFPEKLIPLMILNILEEKPLPVYGDGSNVRDWLYVEDHAAAIYKILNDGKVGETYNVGGEQEKTNMEVIHVLCEKIAAKTGKEKAHYLNLIKYVKDRPGHDRRYAINCDKIKKELGWKQTVDFDKGMDLTISWFFSHMDWVNDVRSGDYQKWIDQNYQKRS